MVLVLLLLLLMLLLLLLLLLFLLRAYLADSRAAGKTIGPKWLRKVLVLLLLLLLFFLAEFNQPVSSFVPSVG